jgi:hypothetical protein
LADRPNVLDSLLAVLNDETNHLHSRCLEIIANLTRLPSNNRTLARHHGLVEAVLRAVEDKDVDENRLFALRALQNLSTDISSRAMLASQSNSFLNILTACCLRKNIDERHAALATLHNVITEPGAVVAVTNTRNLVASLVHLAHSPESTSELRIIACEALATISLWLQTLAGTGVIPPGAPMVPLPSHKTTGWERWQ